MCKAKIILTESQNENSRDLDLRSVSEVVDIMHQEDYQVLKAVEFAKPQIVKAIEQIVIAFKQGGRLFYIGSGTSGRLGVLDAVECPPTFSTPPDMVQGIIAGGQPALIKAAEGAEDNEMQVIEDLRAHHINEKDVLVGIAASGSTPYVRAALRWAKTQNLYTVLLTCNTIETDDPSIDNYLIAPVGSEVLSGSTRLKSGTATKLILNMLTTVSMVQLGKVYDNLMVDVTVTNAKLKTRATRMVKQLTNLSEEDAQALLEQAHGEVKTAVVMHKKQMDYSEAKACLSQNHGFLRSALQRV